MSDLTRRSFVIGSATLGLAGCVSTAPPEAVATVATAPSPYPSDFARMYGRIDTEPFPIAAVEPSDVNPAFLRQVVSYQTTEHPGTIVIDPGAHYLYSVREGGSAMRYGVGVGREGFAWSGEAVVGSKQAWPDWYPPKEMLARQPEIVPRLDNLQGGLGMRGGINNPLGARAMYLYQGKKDTQYRIHGTFEPWTIGQSVSSGCIRMINQDAIDLYNTTPIGARVVVLKSGGAVG